MSTQVSVYIEGTGTSNDLTEVCCDRLGELGYSVTCVGREFNSTEEDVVNLPREGPGTLAERVLAVFKEHDPEARCSVVVTYIEQVPFDRFDLNEEE